MININLLPDHLRGSEPTPLPLAVTFFVGLVLVGFLGLTIYRYQYRVIPKLTKEIANEKAEEARLQAVEKDLQLLRSRINVIREHVDAVRTLYRGRTIWARILSDIKHLITEDATLNNANAGRRYLWLTNIDFTSPRLTLKGNAAATDRNRAIEIHARLLRAFQDFTPTESPEVEEIRRIEAELEAIRTGAGLESSDFVSTEERETELRNRLAEIRNVRSGGIALMPFLTFIKPNSLRNPTNFGGAWMQLRAPARPPINTPEWTIVDQLLSTFPSHAWQFTLSMELAPPPGSEE